MGKKKKTEVLPEKFRKSVGYLTWDQATPPPARERREDDPEYPACRVFNGLTPGITKTGRYVEPYGDIQASWIVAIHGEEFVVYNPEEAW